MEKELTPVHIVKELDRFIIAQEAAKRCMALALRNRWRRLQLMSPLKEEVLPKNILMIGPTGVGKTEIARRLARLADAPFLKVEATKFTEIGYVGRDVEQIIRDLTEVAISLEREKQRLSVKEKATECAHGRLVEALVGPSASAETKEKFTAKLLAGALEEDEVEIQVEEAFRPGAFEGEIPGNPGAQMGFANIGDFLGKAFGAGRLKSKRLPVKQARELLILEESEKALDTEALQRQALTLVQEKGIVFLDEIDKICVREGVSGKSGEVSREGVQRDLLPLLSGTVVNTKYGPVHTDHILFIASGAFHLSKPSDLLPELQGRLPIRVELSALRKADFVRILTETDYNLITQYKALLATEGVDLHFTQEALETVARYAEEVNESVENIGARRLHTILEKLLEELSFHAHERRGDHVVLDACDVERIVGQLVGNRDLSRFVL